MTSLHQAVDSIARDISFSGVIRVDREGEIQLASAYGLADRRHGVANDLDTQFGIASGTKGFTALTIVSLIEEGSLDLQTTARSILGDDLPLIEDAVTIEHLLAHRSGIGDYMDEDTIDDITEFFMPVSVRELATTEQYLPVLDGHPTAFPPGARFAYCNGGYVVLALIAERVSELSFHDLVRQRVCERADMVDTAFLRSDELPGRAAIGYIDNEGLRTNVFNLPVRGNGDGGIYTTLADIASFWSALFAGRFVSPDWVAEMIRANSDAPDHEARYGLGFWLHATKDVVELRGSDAGVSFRTVHDPAGPLTHTVISNTTEGAWAITELLDEQLVT